jgi:hypothetical protein
MTSSRQKSWYPNPPDSFQPAYRSRPNTGSLAFSPTTTGELPSAAIAFEAEQRPVPTNKHGSGFWPLLTLTVASLVLTIGLELRRTPSVQSSSAPSSAPQAAAMVLGSRGAQSTMTSPSATEVVVAPAPALPIATVRATTVTRAAIPTRPSPPSSRAAGPKHAARRTTPAAPPPPPPHEAPSDAEALVILSQAQLERPF